MKTSITVAELGALNDEEFLALVEAHPKPSDWITRSSFNAACPRLANIKGLVISRTIKIK